MLQKREKYLHGPAPLIPGSLAEFIENAWWPRTKAGATKATIDGYRSILERAIAPFYRTKLRDIDLPMLQSWVDNMGKSPKTVRNVYGVMSSILQLAKLMRKYDKDDHKLVVLPELDESWAVEGLDLENIGKILEQSKGTIFEGPIWTACFLGLRRNEVCGLKKGHVRFEDDLAIITVQHNRQGRLETNKLKSKKKGATRTITVPRFMGEKLLSFGAHHNGIYIFHGVSGHPINSNMITRCMADICEKAKATPVAFKDLRAACRSNLDAAGVSDSVIMQILGHSNFKTSKRYQDKRGERQAKAFEDAFKIAAQSH